MSEPILREKAEAAIRGPQPRYPVCNETVVDGEVVIFDHGDLFTSTAVKRARSPGPASGVDPPSSVSWSTWGCWHEHLTSGRPHVLRSSEYRRGKDRKRRRRPLPNR